ncbi:helix-turn-helix domain-containing protein [Nocardioides sambongensis]|uniref:helix-turn-helix domain-containing protein n=1 Tax=Nocardioides sambongensis TaxID=2589074 RepID=UPI00112944EA|nr:helix-turn-helix domain-containing protein [Nocardioides sambongensis]
MTGEGYRARQPGAVDSAFAVLEAVATLGPGTTSRDLVDTLPMSKATVYRIVKHLVESEYLVRTPDLAGFMLGRRVLDLARSALPQEESHLAPRERHHERAGAETKPS